MLVRASLSVEVLFRALWSVNVLVRTIPSTEVPDLFPQEVVGNLSALALGNVRPLRRVSGRHLTRQLVAVSATFSRILAVGNLVY